MYCNPLLRSILNFCVGIVKLGDKERFDKEKIGVKELNLNELPTLLYVL
jgi:hypothetical protein